MALAPSTLSKSKYREGASLQAVVWHFVGKRIAAALVKLELVVWKLKLVIAIALARIGCQR
jgi:hypothetical protein